MVVLVDIGNSNIVLGLYQNEKIEKILRLKTFVDKTSDEYYVIINGILGNIKIDNIIISSVVPIVTSALRKMFQNYYNIDPIILGVGTKTGISLKVDDPKTVGSDLICDVAGSLTISNECLIIDMGTATKFIYTKNNALLGVSIAPGVSISMKALVSSAALLPNIELSAPKKVLNNSTIPCMQSGIIYGSSAMIDGMIDLIKKEVNNDNLIVVATGGLAKLIIPLCKNKIIIDDNLVLNGLVNIYKKNI